MKRWTIFVRILQELFLNQLALNTPRYKSQYLLVHLLSTWFRLSSSTKYLYYKSVVLLYSGIKPNKGHIDHIGLCCIVKNKSFWTKYLIKKKRNNVGPPMVLFTLTSNQRNNILYLSKQNYQLELFIYIYIYKLFWVEGQIND